MNNEENLWGLLLSFHLFAICLVKENAALEIFGHRP